MFLLSQSSLFFFFFQASQSVSRVLCESRRCRIEFFLESSSSSGRSCAPLLPPPSLFFPLFLLLEGFYIFFFGGSSRLDRVLFSFKSSSEKSAQASLISLVCDAFLGGSSEVVESSVFANGVFRRVYY